MTRIFPERLRISVSPLLYFFLALLILLIPLRWLVAAVVSVAIHELFHIGAIRCFGHRIRSIQIGIDGARIQTPPMPLWQELLCALAGPMGGIALLLFARWFPIVALCSGFHTLYNLLPVYPQDGGRALRCGVQLLLPERWANLCCVFVENLCFVGVGVLGFYGTFILNAGLFPLLFAILFLWRSYKMKISLQRS